MTGLQRLAPPAIDTLPLCRPSCSAGGRTATLRSPLGAGAPAHLRGATVLPLQEGGLTTAAAMRSPLTLVVALPRLITAREGLEQGPLRLATTLYMDEGESPIEVWVALNAVPP